MPKIKTILRTATKTAASRIYVPAPQWPHYERPVPQRKMEAVGKTESGAPLEGMQRMDEGDSRSAEKGGGRGQG